jgi:hypothetical protein
MEAPTITLVVETATGTYLRTIRPASVLPSRVPVGHAAELATRGAAAYWGLPDFVFHPAQQSRGAARREIGDAIIVAGEMAASVQVKAREAHRGTDQRERLWLDKKIEQASRQAMGTIRNIKSAAKTVLVNQRDREAEIKGPEKTWVPVIVLDHPGADSYVPQSKAVVLLRRDWEFLFEQLKSTYAVLEYLRRVSTTDPVPLGREPVRYYEMAAADAAMRPSPVDPRLALINFSFSGATPMLPQAPAGHGGYQHHLLVRAVLEDIATIRLGADGITYADLLDVLAALDATPVGYRAELGRTVLGWFAEVAKHPPGAGITWRFRGIIWGGRPYLLFGVANRFNKMVQEAFSTYVSLRHQQHLDLMPERAKMMTVGVLLTPRQDRSGGWDTTMAAALGEERWDDDDRLHFERLWGKLGDHLVSSQS